MLHLHLRNVQSESQRAEGICSRSTGTGIYLRYFIPDFIARRISSFQGLGSYAWHIVGGQCRLTE